MINTNKCKRHRFYQYDRDLEKWAVYEKQSPYFLTVQECEKWSSSHMARDARNTSEET